MVTPATDFAQAAAFLARTKLPAYVSFVERAEAHGIAGDREDPQRITVRIADGAIVHGYPPNNGVVLSNGNTMNNPFGQDHFTDMSCYRATSEEQARWNGQVAVRFEIRSSCENDKGLTELYADPQTLRPIATDGNVSSDDSSAPMTIAIEVRYATIDGYSVPSSIRAHAAGHGWLFWARERAEVDYSDYLFSQTDVVRRQSP